MSGIARGAAVSRPTVQGFFDVLRDTLLGTWLPAWRPRAKIKEVAHPKFFLFDPGVTRAAGRRLREPLDTIERGHLLETLVLHELRAHINASACGGDLSYWRTPSGSEVDFVWARGRRRVAIEVESANRWTDRAGRVLKELLRDGVVERAVGVYLGDSELRDEEVTVLPLLAFARRLGAGRILG